MNIAFWSNNSLRAGTTGNMIATGVMISVLYSLETNFFQLGMENKTLEEIFEGRKTEQLINDEFSFYNKKGLDDIIEGAKLSALNEGMINSNLISVKHTLIKYLPSAAKSFNLNEEEGDFLAVIKDVLNCLKDNEQINLIDVSNGESELSKLVLAEADIIIYNLSQDDYDVPKLLNMDGYKDRTLYLIGKYDSDSQESEKVIRKRLSIAKDLMGVVPYNIQFHDAINKGKIVPFIMKNIFSKKYDDNFLFINSLFKSTNMILKKARVDGI